MRRQPTLVLALAFLLTLTVAPVDIVSASTPTARNGFIDLRDWDNRTSPPTRLSGQWEFYWGQLLEPEDFRQAEPPQPTGYINVPGRWNAFQQDGEPVGADGFATYRLLIRLPDRVVDLGGNEGQLALHFPWSFTAYKMWLNGHVVAENGVVGQSADTMTPLFLPRVVHFHAHEETVELIMQVSNFMHRSGGIWNAPLLGSNLQIERRETVRTALDMFLIGGILTMALYHLFLFMWFRGNPASVFLGLTSLIIGVRTLVTSEHMLDRLVLGFPWDAQLRIEYITGYAFLITYFGFLRSVFPKETPKIVAWLAYAVGAAGIVLVLTTPVRTSSEFIPLYMRVFTYFVYFSAVVFLAAAIRNREGGKLMLLGGLLLVFSLLHDLRQYNLLGWNIHLLPIGLFGLLLFQSLVLAQRFAIIFYRQIALSRENAGLLSTVREQLEEVKRSRELVVAADENVRQAIAERLHARVQNRLLAVWHRLGTLKDAMHLDPQAAESLVDDARREIDEVREREIRQVSHALHPSIVRVGLLPAIHSLARQFEGSFNVTVNADTDVERLDNPARNRIPESVRLAVYRVLEEVLGNVQAHAEADAVTIALSVQAEDQLVMTVTDNGKGFDFAGIQTGLGLNAVEARSEAVGGTWQIDSAIGKGTTVTVALPISGGGESSGALVKDPVTQLYSKTYFDSIMGQLLAQAKRLKTPVAVVLAELGETGGSEDIGAADSDAAVGRDGQWEAAASRDHSQPHAEGSEAHRGPSSRLKRNRLMQHIADHIRTAVHDTGIPCRYGGNAFALIVPNATPHEAQHAAQRLSAAILEALTAFGSPAAVRVGVARFPDDATNLEALMERAHMKGRWARGD